MNESVPPLTLVSHMMLTCTASTGCSTSPGALQLSASGYSLAPSAGAVTVTVERVGGSSGIAIASDGTFDGSAVAGTDYTATLGSLTWPDGDATFGTPIDAAVAVSAAAATGAVGYPIAITETHGLDAIGGYSWVASQSIGYTWWGWNDWGGQALSVATPPWVDSTAP